MTKSCGGCIQEKIINGSTTGCECAPESYPFVCERHDGCEKTEHFHKLCRTRYEYFAYWETEGKQGPCLNSTPGPAAAPTYGLGDLVAWLIRKATLGRVQPCMTCKSRMGKLNRRVQVWPIRLPWGKQ